MKSLAVFLLLIVPTTSAQAQWYNPFASQQVSAPQKGPDPAYISSRVTYAQADISKTATVLYDRNGNPLGRLFNTPVDVPLDTRTIAASVAPGGGRIMPATLVRGIEAKAVRTPKGPMVRVLVTSFSRWQPNKKGTISSFGPAQEVFVPVSEFQRGSLRPTGLIAGQGGNRLPPQVLAAFVNSVKDDSGNFVVSPNLRQQRDPHSHDHEGVSEPATVDPRQFSMFPPTCDCARGAGSCKVTSHMWRPGMPEETCGPCSKRHPGIDIGGGEGTTLVAPDRVEVHRAQTRGCYGKQLTLRSLTFTSPQVYYTYSHLPNFAVYEKQVLNPGDIIGKTGRTGCITAPHLHLEVFRGTLDDPKSRIDPYPNIKMGMRSLAQAPEMLGWRCEDLKKRIDNGPQIRGNGGTAGGWQRARQ